MASYAENVSIWWRHHVLLDNLPDQRPRAQLSLIGDGACFHMMRISFAAIRIRHSTAKDVRSTLYGILLYSSILTLRYHFYRSHLQNACHRLVLKTRDDEILPNLQNHFCEELRTSDMSLLFQCSEGDSSHPTPKS